MAVASADVEVIINRPVAEVFGYMADYNNNVNWQEGVVSSRQITAGPPAVGVEVAYVRQLMGRDIEAKARMIAHEPGSKLRMESKSRIYTYTGGYDFSAVDGGTRVHYRGEIKTGALLGLLGKAVVGRFQKQMEGDLRRLKTMLESR